MASLFPLSFPIPASFLHPSVTVQDSSCHPRSSTHRLSYHDTLLNSAQCDRQVPTPRRSKPLVAPPRSSPLTSSIGPAFAIPAVLTKAGISKDDVDFYEINEAFASQAVMSIQHLHLPYEKVNPVGGAIALGHPLGCTGARQVATALSEAKREKKKIFVTSMCIGSGMVSLLFSFLGLLSCPNPSHHLCHGAMIALTGVFGW